MGLGSEVGKGSVRAHGGLAACLRGFEYSVGSKDEPVGGTGWNLLCTSLVGNGKVDSVVELSDEPKLSFGCQCAITVDDVMVVEVVGLLWDGGSGVFAVADDVVGVDVGVFVDLEAARFECWSYSCCLYCLVEPV